MLFEKLHRKRVQKELEKVFMLTPEELSHLDDEKLYEALSDRLFVPTNEDEIPTLNQSQLVALAVMNFDSEIQNGGICQFFINSSSAYAPYISDSLYQIRSITIRNLFDDFIVKAGIDVNNIDSYDFDTDEFTQMSDEFDDSFYEAYETENLDELLLTYVRNNIYEIFS